MAFPSFENNVTPVFNRIRLARGKVVLAEWCADHYVDNDNEKLKCLDLALQDCNKFPGIIILYSRQTS